MRQVQQIKKACKIEFCREHTLSHSPRGKGGFHPRDTSSSPTFGIGSDNPNSIKRVMQPTVSIISNNLAFI